MKKIAVLGIGAIGGLIGVHLALKSYDATLVEPFWREHVNVIRKDGLTLKDAYSGQIVKVKAVFIDELPQIEDKFEILFLTVKSNDTVRMLQHIKPYLTENAWVVSPQNGINEDVIIPIVGKANVIPCVSYVGGSITKPGYLTGHAGYFVVGEIDGKITSRVQELAEILRMVARTEISTDVMKERWNKLSQVTMTVTVGCILGVGMGIFQYDEAHPLLARIMCETMQVAAAAGYKLEEVMGIKADEWETLAKGTVPAFSKVIGCNINFPAGTELPPDPITICINQGQPLEIDYTNGYVINKGKELGVPTPVNELIINKIKAIESGKLKASPANLYELMRLTQPHK